MTNLEVMKKYNLPQNIKVAVRVTPEGLFFAKLPNYPGCITEADDVFDLIKNVTDAILTYFEVPRKIVEKLNIVYMPPQLLTSKKEPIDRLVSSQKKHQEHENLAVQFRYFTSYNNLNGANSNLR